MTPDESTIELLENRIDSLKTIAETCSNIVNEYTEAMFGLPDKVDIESPKESGIVENAPFIDKANFVIDETFTALYNVENKLETLKSTIPSRISGHIQTVQNTDIE